MNARTFACGTLIYRPTAFFIERIRTDDYGKNIIPTRKADIAVFTNLPASVACIPVIAKPEHRCSRPRYACGCE